MATLEEEQEAVGALLARLVCGLRRNRRLASMLPVA